MKQKTTLTITAILAILAIPITSTASECSIKGQQERVLTWSNEKLKHIEGNQFTNTDHDKWGYTTRSITITKGDQEKLTITAEYKMQGTYNRKQIHANGIIEFQPKLIHYTDTGEYYGEIKWSRLLTSGYSGFEDLTNEHDSGVICFLPAGRIEIDSDIYQPQ